MGPRTRPAVLRRGGPFPRPAHRISGPRRPLGPRGHRGGDAALSRRAWRQRRAVGLLLLRRIELADHGAQRRPRRRRTSPAATRSSWIDDGRTRPSRRRLRLHRAPGAVSGARDAARRRLRVSGSTPASPASRTAARSATRFSTSSSGAGSRSPATASTTARGSITCTTSRSITPSANRSPGSGERCRRGPPPSG